MDSVVLCVTKKKKMVRYVAPEPIQGISLSALYIDFFSSLVSTKENKKKRVFGKDREQRIVTNKLDRKRTSMEEWL